MATRKSSPRPVKTPAYGMPVLSPLYTPPPYEYRDVRAMLIQFQSDPKVIAKLIPAPLVPDPKAMMSVTVSRFFCAGFGSYSELLLAAMAKYKGRPVNYCLYLLLDNDIAIGAGREIWGFPKKLGRVGLADQDGVMSSVAERGGLMLVRAAMRIGDLAKPGELTGSPEYVNLKLIPSIKNGAPPEVMQLTSTTLGAIELKDVYKGPATLEFGKSPVDAFAAIPIMNVLGGFYYQAQFSLGDGEILLDYLKQ